MNTSHALRTTNVVRILLLRNDIAESLQELILSRYRAVRLPPSGREGHGKEHRRSRLPFYVDDCEQTGL